MKKLTLYLFLKKLADIVFPWSKLALALLYTADYLFHSSLDIYNRKITNKGINKSVE